MHFKTTPWRNFQIRLDKHKTHLGISMVPISSSKPNSETTEANFNSRPLGLRVKIQLLPEEPILHNSIKALQIITRLTKGSRSKHRDLLHSRFRILNRTFRRSSLLVNRMRLKAFKWISKTNHQRWDLANNLKVFRPSQIIWLVFNRINFKAKSWISQIMPRIIIRMQFRASANKIRVLSSHLRSSAAALKAIRTKLKMFKVKDFNQWPSNLAFNLKCLRPSPPTNFKHN